jgi:hypothetical protein
VLVAVIVLTLLGREARGIAFGTEDTARTGRFAREPAPAAVTSSRSRE